ncbi:unnamed protein product [Caenorhabditis sp. 36 PRJEB53466]|nr:unnamed protein product [Caenorhabditis sp. 36 PRJEB53466]
MQKKQKTLTICQTASLTSKMRTERQTETFEPTSVPTETPTLTETKRAAAAAKSAEEDTRSVRIQPEKEVEYDAELTSMCDVTCGTLSMRSISEVDNIEEFEKKCQECRKVGPQLVPIKYVTTFVETPIRALFVSDFDLCEAMTRPMNQAKRIEFSKRFEVEHKFLEEVMADVDKLLAASGRMDVEVKVIKTRQTNDMPRCRIHLIRRMKADKIGESLYKQPGIYGFEVPDAPLADVPIHANPKIAIDYSLPWNRIFHVIVSLKRCFIA